MIAAALILLAAICKAIADTIAHHKGRSVFRNSKFWANGGKLLPGTKYKLDGWHLANSGMIICFVVATVLHDPILVWYFEIPIAGVLFNIVFNVFYNKLLLR